MIAPERLRELANKAVYQEQVDGFRDAADEIERLRRAAVPMTEEDFNTLACAAMDAADLGDEETAKALDKLARKLSAALTNEKMRAVGGKTLKWRDVPTVIGEKRSFR